MELRRETGRDEGLPRWVRTLVVLAVMVVALVVVAMLLLGGEHGPGRHTAMSAPDATPVDR
ncbi:hypothetical protein [Pseudonocardia sp.]|uniref:hypothetical protein n=1 Tax=Pseudonocardia sp. TaxID=60912 RepID=UPI003D0EF3D2